MKQTKKH